MEDVKELLAKLDGYKVISSDLTSLELEGGIKVSYRIATHPSHSPMTFQAVLSVTLNDGYPFVWGCTDEEENSSVVKWFTKKDAKNGAINNDEKDRQLAILKTIIG